MGFLFIPQQRGKKILSESAWAPLNLYKDTRGSSGYLLLWLDFPLRPVLQVVFVKQQALSLADIPTSILIQVDTKNFSIA